ncbi:MAG: mannose-1-phosphate guanylyltransferase, partial [Caldithrix sp.]|nr:mannose-1-phosphate guanylyltransferase [Caldithrix sp.]
MYILLMAGGVGSRFWPRSRTSMPKQTLNIIGEKSMLQMTYDRIKPIVDDDKIIVITNKEIADVVHQQLPNIPGQNIIAEPFGRNTAPCIGLACSVIMSRTGNARETMAVLPADHLIPEVKKFRDTLQFASDYASNHDTLITMGVTPTYPETGYGYIQKADVIEEINDKAVFKVKTFAEKPNLETAKLFLNSGDFLWNSGMFVWTVESIIKQFRLHLPEMAEFFEQITDSVDSEEMDEKIYDVYSRLKSTSIDYGVMEVADNVSVIEANYEWNDVGSWEAVFKISEKDENGNGLTAALNMALD